MKNSKVVFFSLLMFSPNVLADAVSVDPSVLSVKVYRMAVSPNGDCTDRTVIIDNSDDPQFVNFLDVPTLGDAKIAKGSYKCFMIEMADVIQFTPSANSGTACVAGTSSDLEVASQAGFEKESMDGVSELTISGEELVTMYLSTESTNTSNGNVFLPPSASAPTNGLNLTGEFLVSGDLVGYFYADASGNVTGYENDGTTPRSSCEMAPPTFGFRM